MSANEEDRWVNVGLDADETCSITSEVDANGLTTRNFVEGVYRGTRWVNGKFGETTIHIVECKNDEGVEYSLGIWGFHNLDSQMRVIPKNAPVKIRYKGERDLDNGKSMKLVSVQVPTWIKLNEESIDNPRSSSRDEDIPF